MRSLTIVRFCVLSLVALLAGAPDVEAWVDWDGASDPLSDGCTDCHGDFRASPYTSRTDGESWGDDLHDAHRSTMLSFDCDACHQADLFGGVLLNESVGGEGFPAISCVGCHGRAEDRFSPSTAVGDGMGLRQHHWRAGIRNCADCHFDADPQVLQPVGEDVPPPYYFTPDDMHPNKPTDPCNVSGNGEDLFAGPTGLDNDGDLLYDTEDPDCSDAVCGNDAVEAGEDCDDGNSEDGDCCSADCQFESNGSSCSDQEFCNGEETCDGAGTCAAGTPVDCDDGVGCTEDACDETGDTCVSTANDALCASDGLFCNGAEFCDEVGDCSSTGDPCLEGSVCNEASDTCDASTDCGNSSVEAGEDCDDGNTAAGDCCSSTCQFESAGSPCSDAAFCNGTETCNGAGTCTTGTPVVCSDGVACTDDSCDEGADACVSVPNDFNCPNDGLFCNGNEFCAAAVGCSSSGDPCLGGTVCNEGTDSCTGAASDCGNGLVESGEQCDDGDVIPCDGCSATCQVEIDADGDGLRGVCDNCPSVPNSGQLDEDGDGVGNACDNCLTVKNTGQMDTDSDGIGDSCDNCRYEPNADPPPNGHVGTGGQTDDDQDGIGNVCDADFTEGMGDDFVNVTDMLRFLDAFGKNIAENSCADENDSPTGKCTRYDLTAADDFVNASDLLVMLSGELFGRRASPQGCAPDDGGIVRCPLPTQVEPVALSGTVTNDLTGQGLRGVSVSIDGITTSTAADGSYSANPPAGLHTVIFERNNFESQIEAIVVPTDSTVSLDVALVPDAPVVLDASIAGAAVPSAILTASANLEVLDGSTVQSIAWTQVMSVTVGIEGADTETATVSLPAKGAYRDELIHVLSEPPIGEDDLPPNVPLPEGEFPGGLPDRFQVVGVNPLALEEAGLVTLMVEVVTTSGTYTDEVEIHAQLPWKVTTGLENVPLKIPVVLHGKEQDSYDWALLTRPSGSKATLLDATTQNPEFTPDVGGFYEVIVTDTTQVPSEDVTIGVYAGRWEGAITGQDADGRPEAVGCTSCHNGSFAADVFTPWAQTGHAEIFTNSLNTNTHYGPNCFGCHTVGFDPGVKNNGFDDASDYPDFLSAGLINNPGDNWTTVLEEFPETAQLANIQCENCHGPQNGGAHGGSEFGEESRISLSADVCASCHGEPLRHARFQQWQLSGHANYELAIDEGDSGSCSRCHTANGFLTWLPELEHGDPLADITVSWTEDEVHPQTCVTCHDPHSVGTTTGVETDAPVRIQGNTPPLLSGFTAYGVGKGALCMTCHNARRGLRNDWTWDGVTDIARVPHGPTQTDILMGENAYFVDVGFRGSHSFIEDTCVNCHMEKTPPPDLLSYNLGGTNHTFFASPSVCSDCHDELTAETVQGAFEETLSELKFQVEDAILGSITDLIATGHYIDLNGNAEIRDAAEVADLEFSETRGNQAIVVTFADGATVGPTSVTSIDVVDAATDVVQGELYDFTDETIPKAGWNYTLAHNDGSRGVHNPSFAFATVDFAIDALLQLAVTSTLSGRVTNGSTGAGLGGVTVSIDGVTTTTAASGSYSASDLTPGSHTVIFERTNFGSRVETVTLPRGAAILNVALTPVAPVVVGASTTGNAVPGGTLTASANVEVLNGSTIQSIAWTQLESVPVSIEGADTATATVMLPGKGAYKDELIHVLSEPPIGEGQLPPNVPLPEGEFPGGLPDRFQVVGVNPFALEEAALVGLRVEVTTTSGIYTDEVEIHAQLPWKVTTGLENVPLKIPVVLHGKEQESYDWALLTRPSGSKATLLDATSQNPEFTPDVGGFYEVIVTDTTHDPSADVAIGIFAGRWEGAITGQDADGRPEATSCTNCHNGSFAADVFTPWAQTGHAEIFTDSLNTNTHYGPNCFGCHTVGFDPGVKNGGFDDASDYQDFLASGLINNPGDNWTTVLAEYPETAQLANIQCENCHGPQNGGAHGGSQLGEDVRISLSSDVCASCHGEPLRHARFQQWQLSGHANYELAIEEGESGNCSRCHTANGFLAWLPELEHGDPLADITVSWTEDEVHPQTCVTCHDPHSVGTTTGVGTDAPVRIQGNTPPLIAGFTAYGVGKGALCMTCHNSRRGLRNDDTWDGVTDIARVPHGPSQTDILMGENAYFVDVGFRGSHSFIEDTCVNCHMERTPPPDLLSYNLGGTNHTFFASTSICSDCHGSGFNAQGLQNGVQLALDELQLAVEDSILQLIADLIATGHYIDLNGNAEIRNVAEVVDLEFGETRGNQAIAVTFTNGTTVGQTSVTSINVVDAATDEVQGTLYEFADERIPKAGWNYTLAHNDGSKGVHNPTFAFAALDFAIEALAELATEPPLGTVSGTVLDRNGDPVAGASVGVDGISTTTGADGSFSADVERGQPNVKITAPDGVVLLDEPVTVVGGQETSVDMGYVTYDPASAYVGKLTCKGCHPAQFNIHARSGHGFKLNPVVNGEMPTYPFSDLTGALALVGDAGETVRIDKADGDAEVAGNGMQTDNQLGTPLSYDDVSFVIGGYGWKARFIDLDGYIVTGSAVQYNLVTGGTVAYHDGETNKPYDCGQCHTTGWQSLAENGGVNQDGRPGMHGTFEFPGIDCEECHGPGKAHSLLPTSANIVKDTRSEPCGACHTRDGQNRIAASGSLIRHHEQFDELIRLRINEGGDVIEADGTVIPVGTAPETRLALAAMGEHYVPTVGYPDGVGCNGCHNAHATTKYDFLTVEAGVIAECEDCHVDKIRGFGTGMTVGFDGARLACIDCHMPMLSKSALSFAGLGSAPATGDIASHIFKIDPTQPEQFTADGKLAFPYLTTDFACMPCHGGDPESVSFIDLTGVDLSGFRFHGPPPVGTVSGTVVDRNGDPVAGASVGVDGVSTTTGADGSFSADVERGQPNVKITAPDGVVLLDEAVTVVGGEETSVDMGYLTYDPLSDYAGKLTCKGCHPAQFNIHARSGHGFKLNPVVNGQMPTYPFSDLTGALELVADAGEAVRIDKADGDAEVPGNGTLTDNELGTPLSYDDVSFVIGGYGWKARFIDLDGYIVTGSAVQYNLVTGGTVAYHDGETNKPYNCGQCHTTGWQSLAENGGVNQDGLPGMHGTFEFPGIDCEECHGPGKIHSLLPSTANIVKDTRSEPCGVCHTRDGQNRIAASGSLIRHHEQFDELIRLRINDAGEVIEDDGTVIPAETAPETRLVLAAMGEHYVPTAGYPDGVGCNGCHSAHATTKYDMLTVEAGVIAECEDCHADKIRAFGTGMTVGFAGARLQCTDCHMPKLSKSAVSFAGLGSGPTTGDIASHVFKIDPTRTEQFTADGKLAFPYITTTFACMPCHGGDPESVSFIDLTGVDLSAFLFH